ncbi:hypothetical protein [Bifidobacterium biavatii]|uniref:Phage minor structural protein n=1 Tax=Bifidobacterium biavatii DSM 23969 TaxID=1437608 RepID=A0A086ZTZ9_9BIFI|nr:hypothetical protein [Bifidobacterium biavatii]KFI49999.1 phage minor structural protein [Bifidobacterium biavatii DSM 23969]
MTETLPVWAVILTAVIGSGATGTFTAWILRRFEKPSALERAMRLILFLRLEEINDQQVEDGHVCPIHVKERAEQIYSAYHDLGGNGLGTAMIEDIRDAHIKPDPQ